MIDGIRGRYGDDIAFVIGQMVPEAIERGRVEYGEIDAVHRDTPNRRRGSVFVAGPRDSYNSPDEVVHYNAAGQRELGRRMWHAYQGISW